ncbi:MAG: hypothetical protein JNM69_29050 [Archangium sp.]|nr:hypothetical protein [Archangium sp.]
MRSIRWLAAALTLCACERRLPWEDLDFTELDLPAVSVFRAPNERLCGFLDGRFNQNGTLLSPGQLSCDDGASGRVEVLATGSNVAGQLVPGPVSFAVAFPPMLHRFDPTTGALQSREFDTTKGPLVGVDGSGRTLHSRSGALVRVEPDGSTTTLLNSLTGSLLIAPDDRVFVSRTGGAIIDQLVNGRLEPAIACPVPQLEVDCTSTWVHGFDGRGSLYVSGLFRAADGAVSMRYGRLDADRSLHRLPDGPATLRLNGGVSTCSVTRAGALVCAYNFEQSDADNYAHHLELIVLAPGASEWRRVGKFPGEGSAPLQVAAREHDCIAGSYAAGASARILQLRGYRF